MIYYFYYIIILIVYIVIIVYSLINGSSTINTVYNSKQYDIVYCMLQSKLII